MLLAKHVIEKYVVSRIYRTEKSKQKIDYVVS